MYYTNNESYLAHHGIKGQEWGVKNGPPYPLDSGKNRKLRYTSPDREKIKSAALAVPVNIAAMLIPGFGLAWNTKYAADVIVNHVNSNDSADYTKKEGDYEKLSDLKRIKNDSISPEKEVTKVNPRFGQQKGKVNNCGYCTVTMEMRRRGYDVQARSKARGISSNDLNKWFKNPEINILSTNRETGESRKSQVTRTYNQLCDSLESMGNGARGYLGITYEGMLSGHAMYWEVTNGDVKIYDGQSGKSGHANDRLISLADPTIGYRYARLDNLELNDQITEVCKSKK